MLEQLSRLAFIPDSQSIIGKCRDETNSLPVAIKSRLSSIVAAAYGAYAASGQTAKLQTLAEYAVPLDCIDKGIVRDISKALSL